MYNLLVEGHTEFIYDLLAEDTYMISGGTDGRLIKWNTTTGTQLWSTSLGATAVAYALELTENLIYGAIRERSYCIYTLDEGTLISRVQGLPTYPLS
jgi:hypothetical protein